MDGLSTIIKTVSDAGQGATAEAGHQPDQEPTVAEHDNRFDAGY